MHYLKKQGLSRRTFLRSATVGSSVLVGLPLLDAMLNEHGEALAQGSPLPKRFVQWMFGCGVNLDAFEPATPGAGSWPVTDASWTPSTLLSADASLGTLSGFGQLVQGLDGVKEYVNVCTGLQSPNNPVVFPHSRDQGQSHHTGLTVFNGYPYTDKRAEIDRPFASDYGGPTIDQVIADRIGTTTAIRSLQFGVSKFDSPADGGTAGNVISVRQLVTSQGSSLVPLVPERNPKSIWQSIFGTPPAPQGIRNSMLDFVKYDLGNIRSRLGPVDRARIDAHLDGIRALERRIAGSGACTAPAEPTEDNSENASVLEKVAVINRIMADLTAVIFACDLTRVASVMLNSIASECNFGELPVLDHDRSVHEWSHSVLTPGTNGVPAYDNNCKFMLSRFGDWLRSFKAKLEGSENLLDSTIFYCSTEIANGNHQVARQPVLLGGHGRHSLKFPGVHYQAAAPPTTGTRNGGDSTPAAGSTSDVLFTVLKAFDPAATSIGDIENGSSTRLTAIKDPAAP
jgi:hypothetical protein